MKKSIKLSIAMALMMGASAGINAVAPQTASAEISDKFRLEVNGIFSYCSDNHQLGGYAPDNVYNSAEKEHYWSNYTRLQLQYHQNKNIMYQFRLHSGYETYATGYGKGNTANFDQSFIQIKDRKANMVYTLGKKGAFLGQGLVHNSTRNLTGVYVSFGNWYDPTCLQLMGGNKSDGSNFFAANFTHNVIKPWQLSLTYIHHDTRDKYYGKLTTPNAGGKAELSDGTKYNYTGQDKYQKLHLLSVGSKVTAKAFTVQGEYIHNMSGDVEKGKVFKNGTNYNYYAGGASKNSNKAWFVEVFTGPTSDMTSGLPLQKPGTNVWSLKYQDVGANAVDAHNTTFYDDAKGWRLNYGHTFQKGLAADIAVARMKDKGGDEKNDFDNHCNGKWKTLVVGTVSYKFR